MCSTGYAAVPVTLNIKLMLERNYIEIRLTHNWSIHNWMRGSKGLNLDRFMDMAIVLQSCNSWICKRLNIAEHLLKEQQEIQYYLYSGAQPTSKMQKDRQKYGVRFTRLPFVCDVHGRRQSGGRKEGDISLKEQGAESSHFRA